MTLDPLAGISDNSESKSDIPSKRYLKLGNKDISGNKHPCYGNLFDTRTKEQVTLENAVILYVSSPRSYTNFKRGEKPDVKCESMDGLTPAKRVPSPFCHKTSVHEVAEYLQERAEEYNIAALNESRIKQIVDESCDGEKLTACGYTDERGNFWPLCMHAIPDGSKKCKPSLRIHVYDLSKEELVYIDTSHTNLNKKKSYPLVQFAREAKRQGFPVWRFSVGLGGHIPEDGFVKLDVTSPSLIEDPELVEKLRELSAEEKESVTIRNEWVPGEKDSGDGSGSDGKRESSDELDLENEEIPF
jgi:hypothetical protein